MTNLHPLLARHLLGMTFVAEVSYERISGLHLATIHYRVTNREGRTIGAGECGNYLVQRGSVSDRVMLTREAKVVFKTLAIASVRQGQCEE